MTSGVRRAALGACMALLASTAHAADTPARFNLMTVPAPETISPQARQVLTALAASPPGPATPVAQARQFSDAYQANFSAGQLKRYKVRMEEGVIAGVPVRIFYPPGRDSIKAGPLLVNLHGGGFIVDSGSLTENIPIAALTGLPVVAVLYRLAPEHPYPAAVDDAVAVYRDLLNGRSADQVGLYGTSAGAALTAQTTVRLRSLKVATPRAIGFFSGSADFSTIGESETTMPLPEGKTTLGELTAPFVAGHDVKDPAMSPIFADLAGFPPTLLITSTRDVLLSQTARFDRALRRQGAETELVVFEALPHAFWSYLDLPESDEAFATMADFFKKRLTGADQQERR